MARLYALRMNYRVLIDALMADRAAAAVRELDARGQLSAAIPELYAGRGFLQP